MLATLLTTALALAAVGASAPCSGYPAGSRRVRAGGRPRNVTFFWHDEPSHAAAALLMAAVEAGGYTGLGLRCGPRDFCADAEGADIEHRSAVALSWTPQGASACHKRVPPVREASGHSALRLHVRLAPHASCAYAASAWLFYREPSALRHCGLLLPSGPRGEEELPLVVLRSDHKELAKSCFDPTPLRVTPLTRAQLAESVRNGTRPLLFLDYDLWADEPGVHVLRLPAACYQEPHPGLRVVDEYIPIYAPDIHAAVRNFSPKAKDLREVLKMAEEEPGRDVLRAACRWGSKHLPTFCGWLSTDRPIYLIGVLLCSENFDEKVHLVEDLMGRLNASKYYALLPTKINCSNPDSLTKTIGTYGRTVYYYTLMGIVTDARDSKGAVKEADRFHLPMVMAREAEEPGTGTRVANGGARHAAAALRGLLRHAGWARLALLADDTHATDALRDGLAGVAVRYVDTAALDDRALERILSELKPLEPRILFVRMDPARAAALLRAAAALDLTPALGYVWVACDGPVPDAAVGHLALSWHPNTTEGSDAAAGDAVELAELAARNRSRHGVALANAVLTLHRGFELLYANHLDYRNDLHTPNTTMLFWEGYDAAPAHGIGGPLLYEAGTLRDLALRLEWCDVGTGCRPRGHWHAGLWSLPTPLLGDAYDAPPGDGARRCTWRGDDPYDPTCYDYTFGAAAGAVALVAGAAAYARFSYRRQLERREAEVRQQLRQWKERTAGPLAAYLVDRDALELGDKLGEGRFGCVRFALLREDRAPPRAVAVKSLREGAAPAEESDFLREASLLASLEHEHVVRFVGVCAGDGPPLVLMEHAFFGDLLGYLRARRHLAEAAAPASGVDPTPADSTEEAAHVSAAALTRLARDAAAALAYLAGRGVVHRDVRAANCLVDARRALKLSDFGMARRVRGDAPAASAEYACCRRGLFPVLWMAPESLERGVFSAASDVWSFGVLALELVTLGARPYGRWPPLRVLQFVSAGGHPPLPAGVAPQTHALAALCWRRRPEQRPVAAALASYLATHERVLRPAPWPGPAPDAADADSAFGDSPFSERGDPFGQAPPPHACDHF